MIFAPLLAFFRLHPLKDAFYALVFAVVVGLGVHAFHRVEDLGAQRVRAADQRVAALKEKENARIESVSATRVAAAVAAFKAAQPRPPAVVVPRLVCRSADATPGGAVRDRHGAPAGGHGAGDRVPQRGAAVEPGLAGTYDPAPAVIATGRDADAEIDRLQRKVALLQRVITVYQDGGMVSR